jgi:2-methylcitrate dehydratase PrpD
MAVGDPSAACIDFAASFQLEAAPAAAREQGKMLLLDWLGCAIRGAATAQADCVKQYTTLMGGHDQARIIGQPQGNSAYHAAMANAYFGHIIEMDDVDKESISHPGTVVIPAALAAGEWRGRSGPELLAAIIAGYEVMLRIGAAITPAHYRIFHTTATTGVFGSAVAAGRMLGLDRDQMTWAFGNAGTLASGLWQFLPDGAMSKFLHAGHASASGVQTACLARTGFTGASRILEGPQGFFAGFARQETDPELFNDFGARFRTASVSIKPYPCCRHTHSAIDCARALRGQLGTGLDGIRDIRLETYQSAAQVANNEDPADSRQAQFSLKYVIARALKTGRITLSDFADLSDPEVRSLMARTSVAVDPQLDALTPKAWPARLTVRMADGRELIEYVANPKGDPENPLGWPEVREKFGLLVEGLLPPAAAREVVAMCQGLEQLKACGDILKSVNGA